MSEADGVYDVNPHELADSKAQEAAAQATRRGGVIKNATYESKSVLIGDPPQAPEPTKEPQRKPPPQPPYTLTDAEAVFELDVKDPPIVEELIDETPAVEAAAPEESRGNITPLRKGRAA